MRTNRTTSRQDEPAFTPLPAEVCVGALSQMIFEGQAPSESRVEMILDRLAGVGR
ncbi:hypothetical protein [Jannaschia sp. 2305UL9-9]|uniref:hypothetical protein n=1 Tax=Jannaschia sp. 2305UL9-9 TaxID=3121638 RepID=UPI003529B704